MKLFGLGFHKTGNTTLAECLTILGYDICPRQKGYAIRQITATQDYVPCLHVVAQHEAFVDSPWNYMHPRMYRLLDVAVPDNQFILTVRDEEKWFASLLRWTARKGSAGWLDMYATVGYEFSEANKPAILAAYREHASAVTEYFGDRLLTVDWEKGDGWQKLCKFLGKPVPQNKGSELPLPHMLRYDGESDNYIDFSPRFGDRPSP